MMIEYRLIRSRRKTLALYVTREGDVEVRAPLRTKKSEIDRFVVSKQEWISKHQHTRKAQYENKVAFTLNFGDCITLMGQRYPLCAEAGRYIRFDGSQIFLPENLPPDEIKHAVIQLYKTFAKRVLNEKTAVFARHMKLTPAAVRITGAKTRWGSCSGKNSINYSWRLIMAEDAVIDYVVVHELAHIREHNHSDRFWSVVAGVLPDYPQRQAALKMLQKQLSNEDWD